MTFDLACTITGARGFVGRHLVNALMSQDRFGVRIFAVDLPETLPPALELRAQGPDEPLRHVTFHDYDVHQPLRSDFLAVDAFYHFAGIADPRRYLSEPIRVMDLNLLGLKNVLERIVLWSDHRPRIVYSSTSEVYGLNDDVPFDESDPMHFGHAMRWSYALSKAVGEKYLEAYSQEHGIRHTTFRFFNFVGDDIDAPGAGRVLTTMVADAMRDGVIKVTWPGSQTRCFTHIDDAVVPLIRAMTMKLHGDGWGEDYTVNLGNDEEITMLDLAELVAGTLRQDGFVRDVDIVTVPRTELFGEGYDDSPRRRPKLDRAREVFGWAPEREQEAFLPEIVLSIARQMEPVHDVVEMTKEAWRKHDDPDH